MNEARHSAVKHLQDLYTVVVGLGLTLAITKLIDLTTTLNAISMERFATFLVYVVTLIPLYHGSLRHLDAAYLETKVRPKYGILMLDWGLLFVQSCLLLGLALLTPRFGDFVKGFIILLAFDCSWALLASYLMKGEAKPEQHWATINFVTAVLLILGGLGPGLTTPSPALEIAKWASLLTVGIARTVCDYYWCREAYYSNS